MTTEIVYSKDLKPSDEVYDFDPAADISDSIAIILNIKAIKFKVVSIDKKEKEIYLERLTQGTIPYKSTADGLYLFDYIEHDAWFKVIE